MAGTARWATEGRRVSRMNRLPSSGSWMRRATGALLLVAFLPVLLIAAAKAIQDVLGPLIPYLIVLFVLFALYRLMFGLRR